ASVSPKPEQAPAPGKQEATAAPPSPPSALLPAGAAAVPKGQTTPDNAEIGWLAGEAGTGHADIVVRDILCGGSACGVAAARLYGFRAAASRASKTGAGAATGRFAGGDCTPARSGRDVGRSARRR